MNNSMNEEEQLHILKEKIMSYGVRDDEVDEVIKDVNEIIMLRALREYIETSEDPMVKIIKTLPESEATEYFEKNKEAMPVLNVEKLKEIGIQTWSEYFQFMDTQ
jgi:hypothetical protein